jgi:amino acid transporter
MSTITTAQQTTRSTRPAARLSDRRAVWLHGLGATVVASAVVTVLAMAASAAGVSFETASGTIPLAGYAQLTALFSLIGVAMAAVMARVARRPRRTFVVTTVTLTIASLVPDVTFGFDAASAIVLMLLHVVAAVIVIPVLARRLAR